VRRPNSLLAPRFVHRVLRASKPQESSEPPDAPSPSTAPKH
jgi:hypothetical protein